MNTNECLFTHTQKTLHYTVLTIVCSDTLLSPCGWAVTLETIRAKGIHVNLWFADALLLLWTLKWIESESRIDQSCGIKPFNIPVFIFLIRVTWFTTGRFGGSSWKLNSCFTTGTKGENGTRATEGASRYTAARSPVLTWNTKTDR